MPYQKFANADTPAFYIYLIDISESMKTADCGGKPRISVVANALERTRRVMIRRSRRGNKVSRRYGVAMIAYNHDVYDLLGGVKYVDEFEKMTLPTLYPQGMTNTGAAFLAAYQLLKQHLNNLHDCPAPLICHLTDGMTTTGDNPHPIAEAIKQLSTEDGNVLLENIYVGARLLRQPITAPKSWPGVLNPTDIDQEYVQSLWHMASPLPHAYAAVMEEEGYQMQAGARMLIPAETPELIELAFAMSTSTPYTTYGE
jgi:uncharacterized protein YegL